MFRRNILSTEKSTKRGLAPEFLKVGLGNIDFIPIMTDGDIKNYPTAAYFSINQTCTITKKDEDGILIESTLQAPLRSGNFGHAYKPLNFLTNITFDSHEKGRIIHVKTDQIDAEPSLRGDFDFIQTIFDSPRLEKVYGMGL